MPVRRLVPLFFLPPFILEVFAFLYVCPLFSLGRVGHRLPSFDQTGLPDIFLKEIPSTSSFQLRLFFFSRFLRHRRSPFSALQMEEAQEYLSFFFLLLAFFSRCLIFSFLGQIESRHFLLRRHEISEHLCQAGFSLLF